MIRKPTLGLSEPRVSGTTLDLKRLMVQRTAQAGNEPMHPGEVGARRHVAGCGSVRTAGLASPVGSEPDLVFPMIRGRSRDLRKRRAPQTGKRGCRHFCIV